MRVIVLTIGAGVRWFFGGKNRRSMTEYAGNPYERDADYRQSYWLGFAVLFILIGLLYLASGRK